MAAELDASARPPHKNMRDEYRVDPEVSRANLERQANERFLNLSYPSNPDFEIEQESEGDENGESE